MLAVVALWHGGHEVHDAAVSPVEHLLGEHVGDRPGGLVESERVLQRHRVGSEPHRDLFALQIDSGRQEERDEREHPGEATGPKASRQRRRIERRVRYSAVDGIMKLSQAGISLFSPVFWFQR